MGNLIKLNTNLNKFAQRIWIFQIWYPMRLLGGSIRDICMDSKLIWTEVGDQQAKLKTENIILQQNLNSNVILFLQTWSFQKLFSKSTKTFPYLSYSASRAFQAGKRDILSILNETKKSRRKNFLWENVLKSRFMEFLDKAEIVWCWKVLARTSNSPTMQPVLHTIAHVNNVVIH